MKSLLTDAIIVAGVYLVMVIAYKIGFRDGRKMTNRKRLVDYWCRDCVLEFRSEQTPVHAPATECPKCGGTNTYVADTE